MQVPTRDNSWFGRTRDRVAWAIASFALKYIATTWYEKMIEGLINYGMAASKRDSEQLTNDKETGKV